MGDQITMLLILMLTSKGMAGVPRASLVVIAATLTQFNIGSQVNSADGSRSVPGYGPLRDQRDE